MSTGAASSSSGAGRLSAMRAQSRRSTSCTPPPVAPDRVDDLGLAAGRRLQRLQPRRDRLLVERVGLVQPDDLELAGQAAAIGRELAADHAIGLGHILARAVDQVQQHVAALDMAEEAVAQPGALMRALDQAGDVGQHEFMVVAADHARDRVQRGEGIVGDLRLGRGGGGQEGRLAGIGQAHQPGIGDQLQPQPDPALLPGQPGSKRRGARLVEVLKWALPKPPSPPLSSRSALPDLGQVGQHRPPCPRPAPGCRPARAARHRPRRRRTGRSPCRDGRDRP